MTATDTLGACPNCGSTRTRHWCRARDRLHEISDQEFAYSRCLDCDAIFESVRPAERGIGAFYPSDYAPYSGRTAGAATGGATLGARVARRVAREVRRVAPDPCPATLDGFYRPPSPGARLLDFGCGSAAFLDRARDLGWRTTGVDISEATVDLVRRAGHEGLLLDDATWDAIEDSSLDLVRMNHVLEHLYDPRRTLGLLHRKLRPGGRLHVAVPNPRSVTARVFRSRWFSLDCPRHVVLYPPETLRSLLASCGFPGAKICHETLTRDVARSIGYLLHDRGRIRHEQVEEMALRPVLNDALYAPARAAAAFGVSDRYHALALKRG